MAKTTKTKAAFPMMNGDMAFDSETVRENMGRFMSMAGEMTELQREGLTAAAEAARVSAKGAQELNTRGLAYFQGAMGNWMEATCTMAGAKSFQEAVELQTNFAKSALDEYMSQMSAMSSLMADTMREASEPLQAHAGQFVEKLHAVK